MKEWDIRFNDKLVHINGRQLKCEKIFMGNDDIGTGGTAFNQKSGDFSKEMRSKLLWNAVGLSKWMILVTQRDESNGREFVQTMNRVCGPMGINLGQPRVAVLHDERVGSYVDAIQRLQCNPCQMIVSIIPNHNKDRYDAIKKASYCETPMPSQVIVGRTISKKQMLMSVCTKIAIQMASKLGGEPWALKIPVSFV